MRPHAYCFREKGFPAPVAPPVRVYIYIYVCIYVYINPKPRNPKSSTVNPKP